MRPRVHPDGLVSWAGQARGWLLLSVQGLRCPTRDRPRGEVDRVPPYAALSCPYASYCTRPQKNGNALNSNTGITTMPEALNIIR